MTRRRDAKNLMTRTKIARGGHAGAMEKKMTTVIGFLNVNGYNTKTMVDVNLAIGRKGVDIFCLAETKLRKEDRMKIFKEDFEVFETRREDCNNKGEKDRNGGGLAILAKKKEGVVYKRYQPQIAKAELGYVEKERLWITYESQSSKTAVCCVYMGFQAEDDRHKVWNEGILQVLGDEIFKLRGKGFRINLQGDFNSWVGSNLEDFGIPGNRVSTNKNGARFKEFLRTSSLVHLNGAVRKPGDWSSRLSEGLWTRHAPDWSSSTVLDYGVVSSEHLESVAKFEVDEEGKLGGGSDHNMLFTWLRDRWLFKVKVKANQKKMGWDLKEDLDWSPFKRIVENEVESRPRNANVENEQNILTGVMMAGLEGGVGRIALLKSPKDVRLPKDVLKLMKERRSLENAWKREKTKFAGSRGLDPRGSLVLAAEALEIKEVEVKEALIEFERRKRYPVKKLCRMKNKRGRQAFWSYVSRKNKTNTDISALQAKNTGILHTKPGEIIREVHLYLRDIFNEGLVEDDVQMEDVDRVEDNGQAEEDQPEVEDHLEDEDQVPGDHGYGAGRKKLYSQDSSKCPVNDPSGHLDRDFSIKEVRGIIEGLGFGKAAGWDSIPNEALKEAPRCFLVRLVNLYNNVKNGGGIPSAWKKGRLVLIHKKG